MRPSGRPPERLRDLALTRNFTMHAEGSVLVEFGHTKVLCTASIEDSVPGFLRGKGQGWVTAEYGMLPRSTNTRTAREKGAPSAVPCTSTMPPLPVMTMFMSVSQAESSS